MSYRIQEEDREDKQQQDGKVTHAKPNKRSEEKRTKLPKKKKKKK